MLRRLLSNGIIISVLTEVSKRVCACLLFSFLCVCCCMYAFVFMYALLYVYPLLCNTSVFVCVCMCVHPLIRPSFQPGKDAEPQQCLYLATGSINDGRVTAPWLCILIVLPSITTSTHLWKERSAEREIGKLKKWWQENERKSIKNEKKKLRETDGGT